MNKTNVATQVFAEDLSVGTPLPLDTYSITSDEIIEFATQWDPLDFHLSVEAAEASYFGGLVASGFHTMAIFQRLVVLRYYRNWALIAGKGLRNTRLIRPVKTGDTLTGHMIIQSISPDSRRRAHISFDGALWNQDGKDVLLLEGNLLMQMRPDNAS